MKVEYKYKPGQKVYLMHMDSIPTFELCKTCNGVGKLFRKTSTSELKALGTSKYSEIKCFECRGKKKIEYGGSLKNVVTPRVVGKIEIVIEDEDGPDIYYHFLTGEKFLENHIYRTKKEAQKECDRLNKSFIAGYTK